MSCAIGTVNAGAANDVTVTIVATAGASAVPSITNTATVSTSTTDPSAPNNQASAQTTVNPSADLGLTNTDFPDPVHAGDSITYTLAVHNAGPSAASGVTLTDTLPPASRSPPPRPRKGTCSGTTTVSCSIGTVMPGAANDVSVTIVATAGASAVPGVTNTASISSSTADPERVQQPGERTDDRQPVRPTSRFRRATRPIPVSAGGNVTYTLTLHNAGPSAASCGKRQRSAAGGPDARVFVFHQGDMLRHDHRELRDRHRQRRRRQRRDGHDRRDRGRERGAEHHQHGHRNLDDLRPAAAQQSGERTDHGQPDGRPLAADERCRPTPSRPVRT